MGPHHWDGFLYLRGMHTELVECVRVGKFVRAEGWRTFLPQLTGRAGGEQRKVTCQPLPAPPARLEPDPSSGQGITKPSPAQWPKISQAATFKTVSGYFLGERFSLVPPQPQSFPDLSAPSSLHPPSTPLVQAPLELSAWPLSKQSRSGSRPADSPWERRYLGTRASLQGCTGAWMCSLISLHHVCS